MNVLVSIIIPNYNHQTFLEKRLKSVFDQSFQNFEVILLDDASTDGSLRILNDFKSHPKVSHIIVNESNSGSPFKQWEKGLSLAKGEYIWISETDDYADTNFLESHLENLKTSDISVSKTMLVDGLIETNETVLHPVFSIEQFRVLTEQDFLVSPIKNVSCILFRKPLESITSEVSFGNYSIMGDQFFYYQYFLGKKVVYNPNTISYFRRITSSVSNISGVKSLDYYTTYASEHIQFAKLLRSSIKRKCYVNYLNKHRNKIRNRISFKQKISFKYLEILFGFYRAKF